MLNRRRWATAVFTIGGLLACGISACESLNVTPPDGGGEIKAQLIFKGLNAAILSVSGTAANDVYAVGADPGDGLGPYVLHYNGQTWQRLNSGVTGAFWWISVEKIGDAFFLAGANGKIVKLTPSSSSFESFTTPGDQTIFGVWGGDASHIWAVGGDLANEDDGGVVWQFDGSAWSVVDLSGIAPQGLPTIYKVWGRSASDVYAVGRLGTILHYDGVSWSKITSSGTTRTLFTVHGNASHVVATGGFIDGVIVEKSGDSFTNVAAAGTPQLNGVFIPPSGDGVAVGTEASVAFRTDTGWVIQDFTFDTTRDFHATWVDPDGGIWTVGGDLSEALSSGIVAYIGTETINTQVAQ